MRRRRLERTNFRAATTQLYTVHCTVISRLTAATAAAAEATKNEVLRPTATAMRRTLLHRTVAIPLLLHTVCSRVRVRK